MTTGIFAGSFDPIHAGHVNIIKRSLAFCDKLIIAIGNNSAKKNLFSLMERVSFIEKQNFFILNHENYSIATYDGLLAKFAKENKANVIIRGVRNSQDFEYEMGLALFNKKFALDIETVLVPTDPEFSIVSSSMIKEIAKHDPSMLWQFVSLEVEEALCNKFKQGC